MITDFRQKTTASGDLQARRSQQNRRWMQQLVDELLRRELAEDPNVRQALPALEQAVAEGSMTPLAAALDVMQRRGGR
jgi:LAO/AO transport system kinase